MGSFLNPFLGVVLKNTTDQPITKDLEIKLINIRAVNLFLNRNYFKFRFENKKFKVEIDNNLKQLILSTF
jgi:hypothetical protein